MASPQRPSSWRTTGRGGGPPPPCPPPLPRARSVAAGHDEHDACPQPSAAIRISSDTSRLPLAHGMSADRWAALHDAVRWLDPVGTIALILIGAGVALRLSVVLIRRTLRAHAGRLMDEIRWQTWEPLMERAVRFVVYFTAFIMILQRLNVDVTAILASAGVVGVAVGLGAQHMVRDVLAGIALLSEGLIHVGDVITYETHTGTVERIGMRTTQIRTSSGEVWTIPNGRLEVFGNRGPQSGPQR